MKFSERWLKSWVPVDLSTAELCERLTDAGLEVDGVEAVAEAFDGVVVAEVVEVAPHPNADRLTLCQVDAGGETLPIVCGAPNVRAGMKTALALVGAQLPGGMKIRRAKLRGVESRGMLCSAAELGLGDDHSGILDVDAGVPGEDLRDVFGLDDATIVLDLTPNRGDALSIRGLAREVGVLSDAPVSPPAIDPVAAASDTTFPIRVENAAGCPRYLGRAIEGVDIARPSPWWLRERLRRCGLRSIDPVVDVTNYVLLELGQPMHAFDLAELSGGIVVRDARPGESLTLLDGTDISFDDADPVPLLITDDRGPVAIAGVMGGERSGVAARTRDIFLECAFFSPLCVAATARRFGLHTDAAHRYERGVDWQLQAQAMERATALLLNIVGGRPGPVLEAGSETALPNRNTVRLRKRRLDRLIGEEVPAAEVERIFRRLELAPRAQGEGDDRIWTVTTPSHRFDIEREEDLVEEVLRIHGYNAVAGRTPDARLALGRLPARSSVERVAEALVDLGYAEAITYSFIEPRLADTLDPRGRPLRVLNPVSSEHAVMRTSLLPGLVSALQRNLARQADRVRLFEIGQCFRPALGDGNVRQTTLCGGIVCGPRHEASWARETAAADFFDVKGDVERLLRLGGRDPHFAPLADPVLHPGQSASVALAGEPAGRLGRLHLEVANALDLPAEVFVFELAVDALVERPERKHSPLSRQPSVRRDLALAVPAQVPAARIERAVKDQLGELVREFRVFDLYAGGGIAADEKGIGIGLTLQHASRTLTDADINERIEGAVAALESELGARLR